MIINLSSQEIQYSCDPVLFINVYTQYKNKKPKKTIKMQISIKSKFDFFPQFAVFLRPIHFHIYLLVKMMLNVAIQVVEDWIVFSMGIN